MKKKFNYAAMLLGSVALLAARGNGSNAESPVAEDDQFIVGLEAAYAPYNWTQLDDSNGGVPIDGTNEYAGGYDVEIAKKIAEGLDKELVIVKTEWDGLVPALQAKKIDAIIAGMSPTEERKQTISFSDPYLESQLVMVVASDSDFVNATKLADFNSAKVTAQLNTFHYNVIDQIEGVNKQAAMESFSAMRVALQAGVIDGYVSEYPEAVSASNANSDFSFVEFEDGFKTSAEDTTIAIGVRKDETDLDKMNAILSEISDEERQEIMDAAVANQPAAQQ